MGVSEDVTGALRAQEHGHQPIIYRISAYESNAMKSDNPNSGVFETDTAQTVDTSGLNPSCYQGGTVVVKSTVYDSQPYHDYREMGDTCQSVSAQYGSGGNNMPFVDNEREDSQKLMTFQAFGVYSEGENVTSTIKASDDKHITDLVLDTEQMLTVRRLTPLECTRLQGYPDGWVDIPGASDSAKYKALGNSIALPFWEHLAHRFAQYGNVRTIGSLFDGIAGFPLVFKRAGCETTWVSEIEPFCRRVVAYHTERGDL